MNPVLTQNDPQRTPFEQESEAAAQKALATAKLEKAIQADPPALVVISKWRNLMGGYVKMDSGAEGGTEGGRPVYRDSEDEKDLWYASNWQDEPGQ